MKNDRLIYLLDDLKRIVSELESELKSNPSGYLDGVSYEDILKYNETNNDDGWEGL